MKETYYVDNEKTIKQIEYVHGLYELQKHKVKSEEYIKELLLKDYVNTIRENVSRYDFIDSVFRKAQSEVGNKYKNEREHLTSLQQWLREDFLNNDKSFRVTRIVGCGYDGYAWGVNFKGYGKEFRITIPMVQKITIKNFDYVNNGKFTFSVEESKCIWTILKSSYKIKDIADFIKEYFRLDKLGEKVENYE